MNALKHDGSRFRPSVAIGELAVYHGPEAFTHDVYKCGEGKPAPLGSDALRQELTKKEARERLADVAEVALTMAETIDDWWERE